MLKFKSIFRITKSLSTCLGSFLRAATIFAMNLKKLFDFSLSWYRSARIFKIHLKEPSLMIKPAAGDLEDTYLFLWHFLPVEKLWVANFTAVLKVETWETYPETNKYELLQIFCPFQLQLAIVATLIIYRQISVKIC